MTGIKLTLAGLRHILLRVCEIIIVVRVAAQRRRGVKLSWWLFHSTYEKTTVKRYALTEAMDG